VLYHSGLSNDVAAVAREVIARDGVSRLALVGFSMGGNIVLKLAGEWVRASAPAVSGHRRLLSGDRSGDFSGYAPPPLQSNLRKIFPVGASPGA